MRQGTVILIIFLLILFQNCNKETEDFSYCTACPLDEWIGDYSGKGTHFKASTAITTEDVDVFLKIKLTSDDNISANLLSPNLYSEVYYGSKDNDQHYIQIAALSKTLDLSLYKKGSEYKITGTAKITQTGNYQTLTFRVFRESE
jgi:hypothetical protein